MPIWKLLLLTLVIAPTAIYFCFGHWRIAVARWRAGPDESTPSFLPLPIGGIAAALAIAVLLPDRFFNLAAAVGLLILDPWIATPVALWVRDRVHAR